MTRAELITSLLTAGYFNGVWTLDDDIYDPISVSFVEEAHGDWVRSLHPLLRTTRDIGGGKTIPVPIWEEEVYDCDNIAYSFANFLSEALAVDAKKNKRKRGGSAAGKFNYTQDAGSGHARNWFVDAAGVVRSFDAGLGSIVTETAAERASIFRGASV